MARYKATRARGEPCQAQALRDGDSYCFWHSPKHRDQMLETSRRGGSRRRVELPDVEPLTPSRARAILAAAVEATAL